MITCDIKCYREDANYIFIYGVYFRFYIPVIMPELVRFWASTGPVLAQIDMFTGLWYTQMYIVYM